MGDPLSYLWPHIEFAEPLFEEAFVRQWPDETFVALHRVGILEQAEPAEYFTCPFCDAGHAEEVLAWETDAGVRRFAIPCPENGRVILSPEQMRQWSISFDRLVRLLAAALGLAGRTRELEPRKLWRLGRVNWQGRLRDVLFARGFDARCAIASPPDFARHRSAIVFIPHKDASGVKWNGCIPCAVALPDVARLDGDGIEFDRGTLIPLINEADAVAREASEHRMSLQELKVLVSQEVKSIRAHELTDDVLVQAYVQEGSFRKAAEFLSRETGQEITKDKVHRAVRRAGGTAAIARGNDSDSIVRTVASQHRDRTKKIQRRS